MKPDRLDEAIAAIEAAGSLAITCHINPDGDALGSALALAHSARLQGVEAVVAFGGEFVVPDSLQFLDLGPLVERSEFPGSPECLVVFDVAAPDRLGEIADHAAAAEKVVVIDHHLSNGGFGDIAVIEPTAAASAQLAWYLIEGLGWRVDATVAECLLAGLVTDTGRFQYSATTGEVMRVAGRLIDAGARPEVIGSNVYESVPFGALAVTAAVLGRAILEEERSLIWSTVLASDLESAGVAYSQAEGLIDDLRIAREADVALLLKETDTGWKGSMRSRGMTDVAAIAGRFGGGGHHNAAGFHASGSIDEVVAQVRAALDG
jgi:phosphoesterase RecJ-like protein